MPTGRRPITAIVYDDGPAFEAFLNGAVDRLERDGLCLAGLVQQSIPRPGRRKCDMVLRDLATGKLHPISEDRGAEASGCSLDTDLLHRACAAAEAGLSARTALLVLCKFGKVEAALTGNESAPSGELRPMAEAFRTALSQRTILPDTMLAGAAMLLSSQDGETVSPEAVAAASHIAQLLLPLTARIDPDLATRTRAVLVSLPDDAKPGGAIRALGEDLSAMRRALALPEAERKS